MQREIDLTYHPKLLALWKTGRLHRFWFRRYRGLFDRDDLRLANNQHRGGYHFGEWFTAIQYHKKGYKVLQSKYANPNHHSKYAKALSLLKEGSLAWLWRKGRPDLLVYKGRRFFFVEVKRDRDRLSAAQERRFRQIEERFGSAVSVVWLRKRRMFGGPGLSRTVDLALIRGAL